MRMHQVWVWILEGKREGKKVEGEGEGGRDKGETWMGRVGRG